MKLSTIFSKTGKGLQEASGKTSHLSRADRTVLMAIDGKLSVAELAQRVGKPSDPKFQQVVEKLESQGFIREVAPVQPASSMPRPPSVITPSGASRPAASRPASSRPSDSGGDDDLDFTQAFSLPKRPGAPSKPVDLAAKAHETSGGAGGAAFDYKARAEAEARAKAEADRKAKAEAEARAKAIAEAKAKAEAEAKQREAEKAKVWAREMAEAEAKAARDAIARAEAEEARARKEAEEKKLREEAERKAKEEAERKAKEEAERKAKEEAERKIREEEERKRREEAERKAKEEAERKAKEEAERKAREEAERKRREEEDRKRREEEERRRKEEEERKRREEEARRRKEEEERRRREEEERKRREEEERKRREEEERARREEEERARREEEERARREEEERARREEEERKRREEEERRRREDEERRKRRAEEDRRRAEEDERRRREDEEQERREAEEREAVERPIREAEERQRREEDARRAEEDERRRQEDEARELEDRRRREEEALREKEEALRRKEEELQRKEEEVRRALQERLEREEREERERQEREIAKQEEASLAKIAEDEARAKRAAKPAGGSFAERLLADLDIFGKKDDEERKRKEEDARRAKEEAAARKAREKEEKKRKEEEARRAKAEAKAREEAERKAKEEAERKAKEEAERRAKEEAERRAQEELEQRALEERERKEREKRERRRKAAAPERPVEESDDILVGDEDLGMDDVLRDEAKLTPEAREAARERAREERRRSKEGVVAAPPKFRRPIKWGKPFAIIVLAALVAGAVGIHVVPVEPGPFEQQATRMLGVPVKIAAARYSLVNGFEIRFENVRVGDVFNAPEVRGAPELSWLFGDGAAFRRFEIERGTLAQSSLATLLLGKLGEGRMRVQHIVASGLRINGPLVLPPLDADLQLTSSGMLRSATVSGPDKLQIKIGRSGQDIGVEGRAERLALPFLPELVLSDFSMKGTADAASMNLSEWDGRLYGGVLKGSARVRWKDGWSVQGEVRAVEINAAVFAPALLSAGTAEGSGKFTLGGSAATKLGEGARLEGKFTVNKGVLGSVDLSRAIQSGGRNVGGRTQFNELNADGVYERGAVALRNVVISAGALSGAGRLDVNAEGRLGGRIVAEVKTPSQHLRAVVDLSGTIREPQASGN